ncbi:hypothetical protein [Kocuria kalidii]|uniref:hypothetical protein n=1 Tax=Kocuria kalidii TaxID=3376283 RepID=UPI0037918420
MNIAVLILLSVALVLQIIALVLVSKPSLAPDTQEEGFFQVDPHAKARRIGTILAIVGILLASLGSGLSLWALGFN